MTRHHRQLLTQLGAIVAGIVLVVAVLRPREPQPNPQAAPATAARQAQTSPPEGAREDATNAIAESNASNGVAARSTLSRSDGREPPSGTAGREEEAPPRVIQSYSEAARRAMPAVVNILSGGSTAGDRGSSGEPGARGLEQPFGRGQGSSIGSGVIGRADGYILTNYHVIEQARSAEVVLADGQKLRAHLVGADPDTDLAVLKVDRDNLPVMVFGDVGSAQVGDVVLAIGNPFGVGQTVTHGIVSALGRSQLGLSAFENFIQTDAPINPGNSGGALVDTAGRLLGINSAIYSRNGGSLGIGFAIPASTAKDVMEQIIRTGRVTRGYIGVEPQDVTPELAEAFRLPRRDGAIVTLVIPNGPADRAGVKIGDILVRIDDRPIADVSTMLGTISRIAPGTRASFVFVRDAQELMLPIVVGRRPGQRTASVR